MKLGETHPASGLDASRKSTSIFAPAKLNLALRIGETRPDGLHEIRSVFVPLELADSLTVTLAEGESDEVVCEGVGGPNLVSLALQKLREAGWDSPPLRINIDKRIPIAAGLGGGSADAAALLHLTADDVGMDAIRRIAIELGADVLSQIDPAAMLVSGSGEITEPLPVPARLGVVLLASEAGLTAREVYTEADRLGIGTGRSEDDLDGLTDELRGTYGDGTDAAMLAQLVANDLGVAARSLRPELAESMDMLRDVGAIAAEITGSGPTVFGLFSDVDSATAAAETLSARLEEDTDASSGLPFDRVIATGLASGRPAHKSDPDSGGPQ